MLNCKCLCCEHEELFLTMDFGNQPPSNLYLNTADEAYNTHQLCLAQCKKCGFLQLHNFMPLSKVACKHSWLLYNEPEGHLDNLTSKIVPLIPSSSSYMVGMSYKDNTLLQRFAQQGFTNTEIIDTQLMGLPANERGIEKIQYYADDVFVNNYKQHKPLVDVLFVRQILEHAHNPKLFVDICSQIVKENGLIVFELPGNDKIISSSEHCYVWEEHIMYFTSASIKTFINELSLEVVDIFEYDYTMENSIVVILRNSKVDNKKQYQCHDREIATKFSDDYNVHKSFLHAKLSQICSDGKIPFLGAGHLGQKFINFYDLKHYISVFIDDNPHKKGLFMPGCGIEIVNSSFLDTCKPSICLMSLNPESEVGFLEKKKRYIEAGWQFISIFSRSENSIFS